MKKINLFNADRELSTRVADYMSCYVNRVEIVATYGAKIAKLREDLKGVMNLEGSFYSTEELAEKVGKVEVKIQKLENEKVEALKKINTFTFTENDKIFKKSVIGADFNGLKKAIVEWCKNYNIDVTDTSLLKDILNSIGMRQDCKTLVTTDGNTNLKYSPQTALNNMYSTLYTAMISVGTIKAVQIPEILREKYAKKTVKKSTK